MGWFARFRRKKEVHGDAMGEEAQGETNRLLEQLEREPVTVEKEKPDLRDDRAVSAYLERLYEAVLEAERQCGDIKFEYGQVTSYLKDIQLLEQAPEEEKTKLLTAAQTIVELTAERKKLQKQEYKFTDAQRRALENHEENVQADIEKLFGFEELQIKIRNDLRQLEGEKRQLLVDKKDIIRRQSMLKTLGKCLTAVLIVTGVMLMVLAFCFKIDIGPLFAAAAGVGFVLAALVLNEARKNRIDMVITEKKCNRAVSLSNRVKIKYVNNVRTIDYMYLKYQVRNATELDFVNSQYRKAKREWARQRENSARISENSRILLEELKRLGLRDCDIWLGQVQALVEPKEMVEVRHALNVQRQKLREQLDYNAGVIEECLQEMENIRDKKPEYAEDVERILGSRKR